MLLQFSVENYKSFKNRVVLSLEASSDSDHADNVVSCGRGKYLKVATIFGANATGKSNLFHALSTAILLVRLSNMRRVGEPLDVVPFKFDEETIRQPSKFEFVFLANQQKYVYGFSATATKITAEYLYLYKSAKPSILFERDEAATQPYRFTSLRAQLAPLIERNTENKLFLATASEWNCEATRIPLTWFFDNINVYPRDYDQLIPHIGPMYESEGNALRDFAIRMLREADIHIDSFDVESETTVISREQLFQHIPPVMQDRLALGRLGRIDNIEKKDYRIRTTHSVDAGVEGKQTYQLDIEEESQGTQKLFAFGPIIKRAFEKGETVCIDEFDSSLHPLLAKYLIGLFNNPLINRANAQLIVSTHGMELLSLRQLRRDQIYFTDKDRKSACSELYSLDEYTVRRQEDVRKAYLLGRFGSVPTLGEGDSLWQ